MTRNVYSPQRDGFIQDSYADQAGTAYIGMLANASDYNFIDSYVADESVDPDGLIAGIGFVKKASANPTRPGINQYLAKYPAAGATLADFEGVLVRHQQMSTNSAGFPCVYSGELCNGLRRNRVGGRPWVMLSNGTSAVDGNVHWIVSDTTNHGHQIGSFSAMAIAGDTVELTFMKFKGVFAAPVGGYVAAKVEINIA